MNIGYLIFGTIFFVCGFLMMISYAFYNGWNSHKQFCKDHPGFCVQADQWRGE